MPAKTAVALAFVFAAVAPATALASPQVSVMYPADGTLTSSPREDPPHHHFWGNFAVDDAAGRANTAVYARFSNPSGRLSLSVIGTFEPCKSAGTGGRGVIVGVAINGKQIGRVYYAHLSSVTSVRGGIKNGAKLGVLYSRSNHTGCWQGQHVHVEPRGQDGSCFLLRGIGSSVTGRNVLGVLGGGYVSGDNKTCPQGASKAVSSPRGHLDLVSSTTPGKVRVGGWAKDPDDTAKALSIHVYVGGPAGKPGGEKHNIGQADRQRSDIGRHAFDKTFDTEKRGSQAVCVYAINIGAGSNSLLGCKTVRVAAPAGEPTPTAGAATWYLRNRHEGGAADLRVTFGLTTDTPVVGDWDGDGHTTLGVVRRQGDNLLWALRNKDDGPANPGFGYGRTGDIPVVGDWDGDGDDTVGVYRPSTRTWYLRNSNTPGEEPGFGYGTTGDLPVVGDWDGDGDDTVGVFRPSTRTWYLRNSNTPGAGLPGFGYGRSGDTPLAGDWNGDGKDTVGVYRPDTSWWYLRNSNNAGVGDEAFVYGTKGDVPVIGDWNDNGSVTAGVFR